LRSNPEEEYQTIRSVALEVINEFDGLSSAAFWAEVQWRIWPRPEEIDIKAAMLRISVHEGWIEYDSEMKVRKRE